jgi:hypothetical protein
MIDDGCEELKELKSCGLEEQEVALDELRLLEKPFQLVFKEFEHLDDFIVEVLVVEDVCEPAVGGAEVHGLEQEEASERPFVTELMVHVKILLAIHEFDFVMLLLDHCFEDAVEAEGDGVVEKQEQGFKELEESKSQSVVEGVD